MPLHLGARVHAFIGGLGKGNDRQEVLTLYNEVVAIFRAVDLSIDSAQSDVTLSLTPQILKAFDLPPDHPQAHPIASLISSLLSYEKMFELPKVHAIDQYSVAECWEVKDKLRAQQNLVTEFDKTYETLRLFICHLIDPVYQTCPMLLQEQSRKDIAVPSHLISLLSGVGTVANELASVCYASDIVDPNLFPNLRRVLEQNLVAASGGNPRDTAGFSRQPKYAHKSDIRDPNELIDTYLGRTPLAGFFNQKVRFALPTDTRFEHHHIVAGSGHGKTQTLQHLIAADLKAVLNSKRSVVVIDSQGDLIKRISGLRYLPPVNRCTTKSSSLIRLTLNGQSHSTSLT